MHIKVQQIQWTNSECMDTRPIFKQTYEQGYSEVISEEEAARATNALEVQSNQSKISNPMQATH